MGFMADLDLRPERRDKLAAELGVMCETLVPGSEISLRGSLAAGTADKYSDIDLLWSVPDGEFSDAVTAVAGALAPTSSVRTSPDYARSDRRRLVFIRLAGFPLFWRIDLDIRACSIAGEDGYDDDNAAALDTTGWSRPASAIENAIAAIKSAVRGRTGVTTGLLSRGYERIGLVFHPDEAVAAQITRLADGCAALDRGLLRLAAEVREVATSALGS
jgi:predicted nucleotidyltransferase